MRLTNRMKPGARTLFIGMLTMLLVFSVFACPLWMGLFDQCKMPCPKESSTSHCPMTVCQLSSPYLAGDSGLQFPVFQALVAEHIPAVVWTSAQRAERAEAKDASPPGQGNPLFLRSHSLLI